MNEVEKMYRNAGVEKITITYYCNIRENEDCPHEKDNILCKECVCGKPMLKYPSFTAEKQLNILKIIVHSFTFNALDKPIWDKGWDVAIAKLVNIYWEVLTDTEKAKIKNILRYQKTFKTLEEAINYRDEIVISTQIKEILE